MATLDFTIKPLVLAKNVMRVQTGHWIANHCECKQISCPKEMNCKFVRSVKVNFDAPAENRTRGPTMATSDFTTKPLVLAA
jgi:hypothetical protein